jgi:hypothetical protein
MPADIETPETQQLTKAQLRGLELKAAEADKEKERQEKLEGVKQRIETKRDELNRCLDADYAAQVEARKPVYEYRISCNVPIMEKGKRTSKKLEETVRGKSEDDAWAHFCDAVQHWPSPKGCGRKIVKLTKGKTP